MKLDSSLPAVVTGGASGLGLATAEALAASGVKVALFDMNAEKAQAEAERLGGSYAVVNVADEASVEAGFAKVRAEQGQERVLVNCAGFTNAFKTAGRDRKTGGITEFPIAEYRKVIEVNQIGSFICTVKSAAGMLSLDAVDGERGAIISTASVAAEDGQIGQVAYAASKAAIKGMTLPIARDLAAENIRVNAILPGLFATPLLMGLPENVRDALGAMVPNPARLGDPSEYASLVLEMIRNPYFNGESVRLDGAIRMAPR